MEDETVEEVNGQTYGPLKALCERAAEQAMPGRNLVVRPGLIIGPHDPSDRFTYWPHRVARGGEVMAPDRPDLPIQLVDVRDLAAWLLRMIQARHTGVYNATGPSQSLTMGELLETCKQTTGSDAAFTWVPEEFLLEQQVRPWIDQPLWLPKESRGLFCTDCEKAWAAGLSFRPLGVTVRDTLAWAASRPPGTAWRAGISLDRERDLLRAWANRG
ncbi:MAG: hypothetical protein AB1445_05330 [Bacillota bacterium]